uniref:Ig-like domain-containing protein n=1 Tax=Poecilia latipinna TaxID=48699 RepID=A0A3B3UPX7_9TELE
EGETQWFLNGRPVAVQGSCPVIYHQTQICAVTGSAVTISCSFSPPARDPDAVLETQWFLNGRPVGLRPEPDSAGRVQTLCGPTACTLRLTDLRESDSGRYRFWFRTNHGSCCGSPGVSLNVTGNISLPRVCKSISVSSWFLRDILNQTSASVSVSVHPADSFSCSVKGNQANNTFSLTMLPPADPPLPPSVSVSPSAEVQEGSSVTLTCSSDANPAASYSWYKEDEESPRASGQTFIITDVRPEHSGNYSCRAENTRGRQSSTVHLEVKGQLFSSRQMKMKY